MFFLIIFLLSILFAIVPFLTKKYSWEVALTESTVLAVLVSIYGITRAFSVNNALAISVNYPIDKSIGISFLGSVTPLSLTLIFLSSIVIFTAIYVSGREKFDSRFYGLLMTTELGLFGLLYSRNFIFFYIFWEAVIIPVFLLIAIYGDQRREKASLKFFVYTQIGSVFLLLSILTLFSFYFNNYHVFTLNMLKLLSPSFISKYILNVQPFWAYFIYFGFLFAFLVKMPSFPLHSWLPDAYTSAPYPVTIVLAGGISLMGGYGFFDVLLPISSVLGSNLGWLIITLGIISLIYFAFTAMFQPNVKRMLSYASAASMGFINVSLGIAIIGSGNSSDVTLAVAGGIYQILAHGLIMALLFGSLFFIMKRTKTEYATGVSGLFKNMPVLSSFMLGGLMASLGLPGLAGFIAEASIVLSSYYEIGVIIFLIIFGMIITASYHIWVAQRTLNGPYNENLGELKDGNIFEIAILAFLFLIILLLGVYPNIFYSIILKYVEAVL